MSHLIDLSVISSTDFEGAKEKIEIESYELISYQKKTLKLQVNFRFPEYISLNAVDPDRLRVFFKETWFFIDEVERQTLQPGTILTI